MFFFYYILDVVTVRQLLTPLLKFSPEQLTVQMGQIICC